MTTLHDAWRLLMATGRGRPGWFEPEPAADEAAIADAERRLKRRLPAPLVEMLRLSRRWSWYQPDVDEVFFLAPGEIVRESRRPANPDEVLEVDDAGPGVKARVYSPARTTFAMTDYLRFQIDEDPAPGGHVGQVVRIDFEEGTVVVAAPSFEAFLAAALCALQAQLAGGGPDAAARVAAIVIPEPAPPPPPLAAAPARPAKASRRFVAAAGDEALTAAAKALGAAIEAASPELGRRLRKGMTAARVRAALRADQNEGEMTDRLLPLYAVFDGQSGRPPLLPCPAGVSPGLELLSVADAAAAHCNETGRASLFAGRRLPPEPGVRDTRWHTRWYPVARSPLGDSSFQYTLFVDFAPAEGGVEGQLVLDRSRYEDGVEVEARRERIAASLPAWLQGLADDLARGRLVATGEGLRRAP